MNICGGKAWIPEKQEAQHVFVGLEYVKGSIPWRQAQVTPIDVRMFGSVSMGEGSHTLEWL